MPVGGLRQSFLKKPRTISPCHVLPDRTATATKKSFASFVVTAQVWSETAQARKLTTKAQRHEGNTKYIDDLDEIPSECFSRNACRSLC
jgi:hypothetical protein